MLSRTCVEWSGFFPVQIHHINVFIKENGQYLRQNQVVFILFSTTDALLYGAFNKLLCPSRGGGGGISQSNVKFPAKSRGSEDGFSFSDSTEKKPFSRTRQLLLNEMEKAHVYSLYSPFLSAAFLLINVKYDSV